MSIWPSKPLSLYLRHTAKRKDTTNYSEILSQTKKKKAHGVQANKLLQFKALTIKTAWRMQLTTFCSLAALASWSWDIRPRAVEERLHQSPHDNPAPDSAALWRQPDYCSFVGRVLEGCNQNGRRHSPDCDTCTRIWTWSTQFLFWIYPPTASNEGL